MRAGILNVNVDGKNLNIVTQDKQLQFFFETTL